MLTSFKNLKKFQLSEYILLALFAFSLPFSWRIATYVMMALFANVFLKGVFEEGFNLNPLQYKHKLIYLIFIAFWAIYAISFLYSENSAEARVQIGKKLPFLLFPLFFLFSNLSYLTKDRVRTIMYCFVIGILTLFVVNLVWAGYDVLFRDYNITRITSPHRFFKSDDVFLMPMHRAHFSLFTCLALVFCFVELFSSRLLRTKIFNGISLLMVTISPFFVTSRAGILCEILVLFILWIWLTFVRKEKMIGMVTGITIIMMLSVGYFSFPKTIDRFTKAITRVKEGKGDIRLTLRNSCRYAIVENFVFGVGAGDRCDETMKAYRKYRKDIISNIKPLANADLNDFEQNRKSLLDSIDKKYNNEYTDRVYAYAESLSEPLGCDYNSVKENLAEYQIIDHTIKYELNAHNQFSDTIIAVGLMGLMLLILFFVYPVYLWIKNKNFDVVFFSLLIIIAFNSLFESVFERQMGIMFFVFFYFLLFHGFFCQQSTDNSQQTLSNLK